MYVLFIKNFYEIYQITEMSDSRSGFCIITTPYKNIMYLKKRSQINGRIAYLDSNYPHIP